MLYKRSHSRFWWCKFTAPDESRVQRSTRTVEKREAQEFEDRLRALLWRIAQLGDKPRRTWQAAVVRWARESTHKRTLDADLAHLRWADPWLGKRHLDEINRDLLDDLGAAKLATGVQPATAVRMLKEPKRRIRWLNRHEADRLCQVLPGHLRVMAGFSFATGLRERNVTGVVSGKPRPARGLDPRRSGEGGQRHRRATE